MDKRGKQVPVGGRLIRHLALGRREVAEVVWIRLRVLLTNRDLNPNSPHKWALEKYVQRFFGFPHLLNVALKAMPHFKRLTPDERALLATFHSRKFISGDV